MLFLNIFNFLDHIPTENKEFAVHSDRHWNIRIKIEYDIVEKYSSDFRM